ncbi:YIPF5-like protein [Mya arenaria]|uniref:YIPF5-like protein n=1 Tax=Mya arenaria TaxID=6604 RepID=A0ABY7DQK9_MYAAR|nr:YIPF5-like protein [Mya arenaria]
MHQQQLLVAYPCCLVYAVFALLTRSSRVSRKILGAKASPICDILYKLVRLISRIFRIVRGCSISFSVEPLCNYSRIVNLYYNINILHSTVMEQVVPLKSLNGGPRYWWTSGIYGCNFSISNNSSAKPLKHAGNIIKEDQDNSSAQPLKHAGNIIKKDQYIGGPLAIAVLRPLKHAGNIIKKDQCFRGPLAMAVLHPLKHAGNIFKKDQGIRGPLAMAVLHPLKHAGNIIKKDQGIRGPLPMAVLHPLKQTLVFCQAFGGYLMLSGKLHFGYLYGIGVVGCLAIYALLNLMSMTGVSSGCIISVLGYCILPMVILSFSSICDSLHVVCIRARYAFLSSHTNAGFTWDHFDIDYVAVVLRISHEVETKTNSSSSPTIAVLPSLSSFYSQPLRF